MIGRIYVGYHLICYILNIQALGLAVSEKNMFSCFPIISLWEISAPQGRSLFGPQGHGDLYTQNIKALGLMVLENIFFVFLL